MDDKTICIDFDGVIADYSKYNGKGFFGNPLPGAVKKIRELKEQGWTIIIYTTRSETHQLKEYLDLHRILYDYINYNPENIDQGCNMGKPLATVYLDDRAINFDGDWDKAFNKISDFEVWYRK